MSFLIRDKSGKPLARRRVRLDCSDDDPIVEQHHKAEVDINNIVRRHGADKLYREYVTRLQSDEFRFDDVTGNDFQEAMNKVKKAQDTFDKLPSAIRKEFDHNPAVFMDFVQNPDNADRLVELGLASRPVVEAPVKVQVVSEPDPTPASE